jgi:acetyl/propionyl-CoA carboxylase alpha subunit
MRLCCGSEVFDAGVSRGKDAVRVTLAGRTLGLELSPLAAGSWLVRSPEGSGTLHLARDGDRIHVFWDGVQYTLSEQRSGGGARARGPDARGLEAPMPGRVSAVKVKPGDTVTRGQELLVVEAMKMENALRAPHAGVVRAVHARVGEMVAPGRALVEIAG